jgi:hypothetical protein
VNSIEKRHDKHTLDAATIFRTKGADALFYYLAKDILKKHVHFKGATHRSWPEKWESLIVNDFKLNLKMWYCIPFSCAA